MNNHWFGEIYKKYFKGLKAILNQRGFSDENAEDFINETAYSLLNNPNLREKGAIALFYKSVRLGASSRMTRMNKGVKDVKFEILTFKTPESDLMLKQDIISLNQKINLLPSVQKNLILKRLDGESKGTDGVSYAFKILRKHLNVNLCNIEPNEASEQKRFQNE